MFSRTLTLSLALLSLAAVPVSHAQQRSTPAFGQQYCIVEKASYGPAQGPVSPSEMYSIISGDPNTGAPVAIVRCYPNREAAALELDLLLTQPLSSSRYGSICERKWDLWVKQPEGRPAIAERAAIDAAYNARPGYRKEKLSLCCDEAAGMVASLGGSASSACGCWNLHSVPGARVCRGADGRIYSEGSPITLPTRPANVIASAPWAHTGSTVELLERTCFAADPGAARARPEEHYQWASQQSTDTLAGNIAYKIGLLYNCAYLGEESLRSMYADISERMAALGLPASCFGGDLGVVSRNRQDHYNYSRTLRRDGLRQALSQKLVDAIRCLSRDRTRQLELFTTVSAAMTQSAGTQLASGGSQPRVPDGPARPNPDPQIPVPARGGDPGGSGPAPTIENGAERYGPITITSQGWISTGISLRKGDRFTVKTDGAYVAVSDGTRIGPGGGGYWGWWVLAGKIGTQHVGLGPNGSGTAEQDGILEIGSPRGGDSFPEGDKKNLSGSLSSTVWVMRLRR